MEFQKSVDNYVLGLTKVTQGLIELKTGNKVPPSTMNAWGHLAVAMRFIDHQVDTNGDPVDRRAIGNKVVGYLNSTKSELVDSNEMFSSALSSLRDDLNLLPTDQSHGFMRSVGSLFKVTEQIRLTDDPTNFTFLTRLEGQITSRLFTSFLPDEFQNQGFLDWFHRVARVGNLTDTFIDLTSDYQNQQARIKPSPLNYMRLVAGIVPDLRFLIRNGNLGLVRDFFRLTNGFYHEEQAYAA